MAANERPRAPIIAIKINRKKTTLAGATERKIYAGAQLANIEQLIKKILENMARYNAAK